MTRENFEKSLDMVLAHEGGFSNHRADPGGATMKGVTQRTYDAWRDDHHQPRQSVRSISGDEIGAIYRSRYWNMVRGDDLPAGVDYAVFDLAVNSGPDRAIRMLQSVVGTSVDGKMGPATLAKVRSKLATAIIADLCRERLEFLRRLTTWSTFGRGWQRRVDGVLTEAMAMVRNAIAEKAAEKPAEAAPAVPVSDAAPPEKARQRPAEKPEDAYSRAVGGKGVAIIALLLFFLALSILIAIALTGGTTP